MEQLSMAVVNIAWDVVCQLRLIWTWHIDEYSGLEDHDASKHNLYAQWYLLPLGDIRLESYVDYIAYFRPAYLDIR